MSPITSSSTHRGGSSVSYTHDDANRMTAVDSSSQTYDAAGNLTHTAAIYGGSSSAYTLVYDHNNRLTQVKNSIGTSQLAAFTWDALGRRIRYVDDTNSTTTDYYYDGVNEVYEYDGSGDPQRYFVHGISYVDERLAMVNTNGTSSTSDDVQYYYVLDRMYNVRAIIDHAGSIVERYCYDPYGKPLIRESVGRGDMQQFGQITSSDNSRYSLAAIYSTIWDPRADMDDDGDLDSDDTTLYNATIVLWNSSPQPVVEQAYSDVGNPYMFQGVPHFAIDTSSWSPNEVFSLNHHRARFAEPVTGRWVTRDPMDYADGPNSYQAFRSNPNFWGDSAGTVVHVSGGSSGCGAVASSLNESVGGAGGCPFGCDCDGFIFLKTPCAPLDNYLYKKLVDDYLNSPDLIEIQPTFGDPDIVVDAFDTDQVDISDLAQFDDDPGMNEGSANTRAEVWIHILEERKHGQNGDGLTEAHEKAIKEQNKFRDASGQKGHVVGNSSPPTRKQAVVTRNDNNTGTIFYAPNGPIKYVHGKH